MAIHSLTYGGAARNFPSLPIPISAMTVLTVTVTVTVTVIVTDLWNSRRVSTVLLVCHRWNREHVPVHSIRITEKIIYIVDR